MLLLANVGAYVCNVIEIQEIHRLENVSGHIINTNISTGSNFHKLFSFFKYESGMF